MSSHPPGVRCRGDVVHAFTLVELLVVIGIIALLIGILLPVLGRARESANAAKCLSNMRQLALAQTAYASEQHGFLVQAGMAERGASADASLGWFVVLQRYSSNKLLARCPSDDSPYWDSSTIDVAQLIPGTNKVQMVATHRVSSYGINDFLDRDLCPWGPHQDINLVPPGGLYVKITKVRYTSRVIQFIEMARLGDFAVADHCHIENWVTIPPWVAAAKNLAINAHGNKPGIDARANYTFLDGHAETLPFRSVFTSFVDNQFDPAVDRNPAIAR